MSSGLNAIEAFLAHRPFERGPWLAVAFAGGIAAWLNLPGPAQWTALMLACAGFVAGGVAVFDEARFGHLRVAVIGMALMVGAGTATVWMKSALAGQPPVARPQVVWVEGPVIDRREEPAKARARVLVRTSLEGLAQGAVVRLNIPEEKDAPGAVQGAVIRVRARLMPPAPPMLPGAYDFARTAWFSGIAATGTVLAAPKVVRPSTGRATLRRWQHALSAHVRAQLGGSPGSIAAAFASGDRGGIAAADDDAMRDAGLTHLLSISGLHVSALVAAVYFIVVRVLGLFPWIALRLRLPLVAAAAGAMAGVGYTLLTGAEVPTVRSCIGALLVLVALALGRDPLSLRMVTLGALFVMLFWPESLLGPSFQMSFAAVISIVAFHSAAPVKAFASVPNLGWLARAVRHVALLLATGVVIELVLMPIGLFHFHRAGVYGSVANVFAIPLTTFVTMPLIATALVMDLAGAGAPAWWLVGKSLELLLWIARVVAAQPGAVTRLPPMEGWSYGLFLAGALWLGLWTGRLRLWGLVPAALALVSMVMVRTPDVLVTGDGHHVGIAGEGPDLLVLREGRGDYMRDNLLELAGMEGEQRALEDWPGARCNRDFCALVLHRDDRDFALLMTRGRDLVDDLALAAACERADIVIAERRLPASCTPRLLKADRAFLSRTGGLSIDLGSGRIRTVAQTQGHHGWYRWPDARRSASRFKTGALARAAASASPDQ